MMNMFTILGRIKSIEETVSENGEKCIWVEIVVNRHYKNPDGIYENDIIKVKLYSTMAKGTLEYCSNGDLMAVKGRIENHDDNIVLIAEKVSFLNQNGNKEK